MRTATYDDVCIQRPPLHRFIVDNQISEITQAVITLFHGQLKCLIDRLISLRNGGNLLVTQTHSQNYLEETDDKGFCKPCTVDSIPPLELSQTDRQRKCDEALKEKFYEAYKVHYEKVKDQAHHYSREMGTTMYFIY